MTDDESDLIEGQRGVVIVMYGAVTDIYGTQEGSWLTFYACPAKSGYDIKRPWETSVKITRVEVRIEDDANWPLSKTVLELALDWDAGC